MRSASILAVGIAALVAAAAHADNGRHSYVSVSPLSQQYGPHSAAIGARIDATSTRSGRPRSASNPAPATSAPGPARDPNLYPAISTTSPLLRNPAPLGTGSFWYTDASGHSCLYQPETVLPCFRVVEPGSGAVIRPGVDPGGLAQVIAASLSLTPGRIQMSPAAGGLTGAASWFWLDAAPAAESVAVTLAGESLTVTAVPEVKWRFGDGVAASGTGVAYRPGPAPAEAVTHVYDTRCLPGDVGRNPYVLETCGERGYAVAAIVTWQVSYTASGLVAASGSLTPRTTTTSVVYPVSEARAFLVPAGSR